MEVCVALRRIRVHVDARLSVNISCTSCKGEGCTCLWQLQPHALLFCSMLKRSITKMPSKREGAGV